MRERQRSRLYCKLYPMFIDLAAIGDRIGDIPNDGASLSAMEQDEAGTCAGLAEPHQDARINLPLPGSNPVLGS